MSHLSNAAAEAKKNGYRPGNMIEQMLDRTISGEFPELKKELGSDYQAFLISRTSQTIDQMAEMIQQGTDPREAKHLAIHDMLMELEEPESEDETEDETTPSETGDTPTESLSAAD